jgi:hypothetical protein
MASKLFRIKRNWAREQITVAVYDDTINDNEIEEAKAQEHQLARAGYTREIVYVETPVEDFEQMLVDKTIARLTERPPDEWKRLRWAFTEATITSELRKIIQDEVEKTTREAFRECARELKYILKKIW